MLWQRVTIFTIYILNVTTFATGLNNRQKKQKRRQLPERFTTLLSLEYHRRSRLSLNDESGNSCLTLNILYLL